MPYPSWFGGNVHGGDGKPSPYCERPCGHRGPGERDLYTRGSAGPAVRPLRSAQGRLCGFPTGVGSCRAVNKIIRIATGRTAKTASRWKSRPPFRLAGWRASLALHLFLRGYPLVRLSGFSHRQFSRAAESTTQVRARFAVPPAQPPGCPRRNPHLTSDKLHFTVYPCD